MASPIDVSKRPAAPTDVAGKVSLTRRICHGRGGDTLGIAWLNDSLHCLAFRRQQPLKSWASPTPVTSIEAFALALDEALAALDFGGTETFLILAHDEFVHQSETAPGFSEGSARAYLRGLMERFEKENGRVLWVSQRAAPVRNEAMYLVHRLPARVYHELNGVLLARRLDLGRILPVVVPLQQSLAALNEARDVPVLVMAPAGRSTVLIVARPGGELLFSRTILESWRNDPDRVAVEVNRSLLYARQQFASAVARIHLFGEDTQVVEASIVAKCGQEVKISTSKVSSETWLTDMAKLPARHPVNLVAGHLRRKRQVRLVRRVLLAACWVGLIFLGVDLWAREQERIAESAALVTLAQSEDELQAEYERLSERNVVADGRRELIRAIADEATPPVAGKFLAYFATVLPAEGRLSEFSVRWDDSARQWIFRVDGVIEADVETARAMIATMRRELTQCPLHIRLAEGAREPIALVTNRGAMASQQQFALEGGLFAN